MDVNIVNDVLDEIALEGLDGITLSTLWIRLSTREPKIQLSLDYSCKCYLWSHLILKNKQLEFFILPSSRPSFVYVDRFEFTDPDTGVCIEQDSNVDCYPVNIIKDDSTGLKGSCGSFKTRKNVTATIRLGEMDLPSIEKKYGETFIVVASQKLRNVALYGSNNFETDLHKIIFDDKIYCFLERIGRSRRLGELTFGHGNINRAFKIKPANTFPLRKKLRKYDLITVQDFSLKQPRSSPSSAGKLMLLTRFHMDHAPLYVTYLSNVSNLLSSHCQERLPLAQVKATLNFSEDLFRKILKLGSKHMKVEMRPYREYFPNALPREYLTKGKNTERGVKVLKLVMPYKGPLQDDEAEEKMHDNDDEDDDGDVECSIMNGFASSHEEPPITIHLDQTTLAHCYKAVDACGSDGLKGKELGKRMRFSVFDMRLLWRSLEKRNCIDIMKVEEGKHRLRKLCLKKNSVPYSLPKLILPCKNSKLDQSLNASMSVLETKDDSSSAQNISMDLLPLFDENSASLRNLTRANTILDLVVSQKIISDMQVFKQRIFDEEGNKLFSTKSLRKILSLLESSGKIKKFVKTGMLESGEKSFDFFCDTSVEEDNDELQRMFQYRLQKERTNLLAFDAKAIQDTTFAEDVPTLQFTPSSYSKPKFTKAKAIHQFLWYLVYGSSNIDAEMDGACVPQWQKHIDPLPKHPGHSDGWCYVGDAVDNMPLSILLDVVLAISPKEVLGLEMYTSDADKIHTRLHDIPVQIVCQLSKGRRYLFKFQDICETLVKLGLLSYRKYDMVKKEEMIMYVHRNASLKNIPDCHLISPLFSDVGDDGVKSFGFHSFRNIHDYWLVFQTISLDNTSGPLTGKKGKTREVRLKFQDCLAGKALSEVVDDGRVPGDGLGPGGTDSTLFANLKRNWCQSNDGHFQAVSFAFSGYVKKQPRARKESVSTGVVEKTKSKEERRSKSDRRGSVSGTRHIKKRTPKCSPTKKRSRKRSSRRRDSNLEEESHLEPTEEQRAMMAARERARKRRCADEIDEEARGRMTRLRTSWTVEEDEVIILCIVTNLFLSNNVRWIVHRTTVRDILHEKIGSSNSKTSEACQRRKNYLVKKEAIMRNIAVHHSQALQDKELCRDFLQGRKYGMSQKRENKDPFVSCFKRMETNFHRETDQTVRMLTLPGTLEGFYEKFEVNEMYCGKKCQFREVTNVEQIDFFTLQNMVHAIALLSDKTGRTHELYELLKNFSQSTLYSVQKYMVSVGIFTKLKRKYARSRESIQGDSKTNETGLSTNIGTYQLTQRYQYKFIVTYPKEIFKSTYDLYSTFKPLPHDPCHGSEFISLEDTQESAALMASMMTVNMLQVETLVPAEIVVIQQTPDAQKPKRHDGGSESEEDGDVEGDDSDFDNIDPKITSSTNSRTLLSWQRCQYTHSKSSKLIDPGNNLFINSCAVKIKLLPDRLRTLNPSSYTSWMNSIHALDKIREWNMSNPCIHPKTCMVILKCLRTIIPKDIKQDALLEQCLNLIGPDYKHLVMPLYQNILASTFFGRSFNELLNEFENEAMSTISSILKVMCALNLVLRVGVNSFRYVCFKHADHWFVNVLKNLKGRGVFEDDKCQYNFDDFPMERTLEKVHCPRNDDATNVRTDELPEENVELVLKHGNFTIKQQVLQKNDPDDRPAAQSEPGSTLDAPASPVAPTVEGEGRTPASEPNASNGCVQSKSKRKPVASKRHSDSPSAGPAKRQRLAHKCPQALDFSETPGNICAQLTSAQNVECRSNETQIDFLIDQISNGTHTDASTSSHLDGLPTRQNKRGHRGRRDDQDAAGQMPPKKRKLDETLYTDFVQDPNFNFSSYLMESSFLYNDRTNDFSCGEANALTSTPSDGKEQIPLEKSLPAMKRQHPANPPPLTSNCFPNAQTSLSSVPSKDEARNVQPILRATRPDVNLDPTGNGNGRILQQLDGTSEETYDDEDGCNEPSQSLRTSSRLKEATKRPGPISSEGSSVRGTYKTVRTLPRPWKTPEGTINRSALSSLLESICLFLIQHPGISRETFMAKYQNFLQPVVLLEFLEILECIGVLNKTLIKRSHKPSLFSSRSVRTTASDYRGIEMETYFVTPDCIVKMGHFLGQLHAFKRNFDDVDD